MSAPVRTEVWTYVKHNLINLTYKWNCHWLFTNIRSYVDPKLRLRVASTFLHPKRKQSSPFHVYSSLFWAAWSTLSPISHKRQLCHQVNIDFISADTCLILARAKQVGMVQVLCLMSHHPRSFTFSAQVRLTWRCLISLSSRFASCYKQLPFRTIQDDCWCLGIRCNDRVLHINSKFKQLRLLNIAMWLDWR